VASWIGSALTDDSPLTSTAGGVFRPAYRADLDHLIGLCEGGHGAILAIEARERERTGISTLKVRYNRVFGYFIEISKTKARELPAQYERKQTLVNAERFVTAELAEHEAKVLSAQERRNALEHELFVDLRQRVAQEARRLGEVARRVALLDVLTAFAEVAQRYQYVRPVVDDSNVLRLEGARHPVVERALPAGRFVPNDLVVDSAGERLLVITGPNMSGKSTVMRQACLITIMAQMGSFVPCRKAQVGVADRIFTRVGASDNLVRGESTFMVEMRETAEILRNATSRSLVILDEIGRGTATYDGISIAWAVAETLHDRIGARCLFATHYHELCLVAEVKAHAANYTVAVEQWQSDVIFLHSLRPGGSSRSYGIEVARLAGFDQGIIDRARDVLRALETGAKVEGVPLGGRVIAHPGAQLSLLERENSAPRATMPDEATGQNLKSGPDAADLQRLMDLRQALLALPIDELTPLQALNRLAALVEKLKE
jgi:DNA mismatch repair protein MutS